MTRRLPIVVEQHPDGSVAYPPGVNGVAAGEGDASEEAIADVTPAIAFHIETFGRDAIDTESPVLEALVTNTAIEM